MKRHGIGISSARFHLECKNIQTGFNCQMGGRIRSKFPACLCLCVCVCASKKTHHLAYQPAKTWDWKSSVMSHHSLEDPLHLYTGRLRTSAIGKRTRERGRERKKKGSCRLWRRERNHKTSGCHSLDTLQNKTYGLMLFISTMMNE